MSGSEFFDEEQDYSTDLREEEQLPGSQEQLSDEEIIDEIQRRHPSNVPVRSPSDESLSRGEEDDEDDDGGRRRRRRRRTFQEEGGASPAPGDEGAPGGRERPPPDRFTFDEEGGSAPLSPSERAALERQADAAYRRRETTRRTSDQRSRTGQGVELRNRGQNVPDGVVEQARAFEEQLVASGAYGSAADVGVFYDEERGELVAYESDVGRRRRDRRTRRRIDEQVDEQAGIDLDPGEEYTVVRRPGGGYRVDYTSEGLEQITAARQFEAEQAQRQRRRDLATATGAVGTGGLDLGGADPTDPVDRGDELPPGRAGAAERAEIRRTGEREEFVESATRRSGDEPEVLFGTLDVTEEYLDDAAEAIRPYEEQLAPIGGQSQAEADLTRYAPRLSEVPEIASLGIDLYQESERGLQAQFDALRSGDAEAINRQAERDLEVAAAGGAAGAALAGGAVGFARENPGRAALQGVGLVGSAVVGGAALERAPGVFRRAAIRGRGGRTFRYEGLGDDAAESGLPSFSEEAVRNPQVARREYLERASQGSLSESLDRPTTFHGRAAEDVAEYGGFGDEFEATAGSSEIPGMFFSADLSPLRLPGGGGGGYLPRPRLPRLRPTRARVAAEASPDVEVMPRDVTDYRRAAAFMDEADPTKSYIRSEALITSEQEAIAPPGATFRSTGDVFGVQIGREVVPGKVFERTAEEAAGELDDVTARTYDEILEMNRRFVDEYDDIVRRQQGTPTLPLPGSSYRGRSGSRSSAAPASSGGGFGPTSSALPGSDYEPPAIPRSTVPDYEEPTPTYSTPVITPPTSGPPSGPSRSVPTPGEPSQPPSTPGGPPFEPPQTPPPEELFDTGNRDELRRRFGFVEADVVTSTGILSAEEALEANRELEELTEEINREFSGGGFGAGWKPPEWEEPDLGN